MRAIGKNPAAHDSVRKDLRNYVAPERTTQRTVMSNGDNWHREVCHSSELVPTFVALALRWELLKYGIARANPNGQHLFSTV